MGRRQRECTMTDDAASTPVLQAPRRKPRAVPGERRRWLYWLLAIAMPWLFAPSVHAWGPQGHQIIATLAWGQLTPQARTAAERLLALEPGATLESVSTWADENRSPETAAWHYVNFPRGQCSFEPRRDCPDGQCVVAAIDTQLALLASGASDTQRLTALKWVVHLVGDVHQPLHAGHADDRGGNRYQLQAFMAGTNLHALWDSGLLQQVEESNARLTARLLRTIPGAGDPIATQAALESCRIVGTPGFYPERLLDASYVARFTPIMEQRLALAAARLAALLNQVLR